MNNLVRNLRTYESVSDNKLFLCVDSDKVAEYIAAFNSSPGKYGILLNGFYNYKSLEFTFIKNCKGLTHLMLLDEYETDILDSIIQLECLQFKKMCHRFDVSKFKNLKKLRGGWSKNIVNMGESKSLEHLMLRGYNPKSKSLDELGSVANAIFFELNFSNIENLDGIERFNSIETLELAYMKNLTDISTIKTLSNKLKRIHFQNCKKINDYSILGSITELKELVIEKSAEIESLDFISELPKLEKLIFMDTTVASLDLNPIIEHKNLQIVGFKNKKNYTHKESEIDLILNKRKNILK